MQMKKINRRVKFASKGINAGDDDLTIDTLDEQLNEIVSMPEEVSEESEVASIVAEANKLLSACDQQDGQEKDTAEAEAVLAEADEVIKTCDELEKAELPDEKEIVGSEEQQVLKECADLEKKLEEANCPDCGKEQCECKKASETKKGIEDDITDTANGGDPSVSEIPDTKIDCDTDKEVFGRNTDSEYVASITKKLDRVAAALERRGMNRMAFRIDQLSDRLEASVRK